MDQVGAQVSDYPAFRKLAVLETVIIMTTFAEISVRSNKVFIKPRSRNLGRLRCQASWMNDPIPVVVGAMLEGVYNLW